MSTIGFMGVKVVNQALLEIIKTEFSRRKRRNKSYSLRSYSRDLNLDPSNLSKILKGKKALGLRNAKSVAKKLGIENHEADHWLSHEGTSDENYKDHNAQLFTVISDWQHYAILELFKLKKFEPHPESICNYLGLKKSDVDSSLRRLQDVGLLEIHKETNQLCPTDQFSSSILNTKTSLAHRNQQRQILDGAIEALDNIPIDYRSQSSMTFAIDSKKIDEAKSLIKSFRRKMGRVLSSSSNLDEVYQLSISFYPLTKTILKPKPNKQRI